MQCWRNIVRVWGRILRQEQLLWMRLPFLTRKVGVTQKSVKRSGIRTPSEGTPIKWLTSWRLMPVTPALWESKVGRSLEVRSLRPDWLTWWNPLFSTKDTKVSWLWWCTPVIPAILKKIAWTQEAETAVSQPRLRNCVRPGLNSKTLSQKRKENYS